MCKCKQNIKVMCQCKQLCLYLHMTFMLTLTHDFYILLTITQDFYILLTFTHDYVLFTFTHDFCILFTFTLDFFFFYCYMIFIFVYRKWSNMDGVKLHDSTPQNDSTLGFKWIKKIAKNNLCSHIFIIHNDHTYITEDYTKLCLNIICNRSFF
jgi:hypothetical protein